MTTPMHTVEADEEVDVVVVGAGAAGLAAAVIAAARGVSVLVLERAEQLGGTSALSAGTVWVPGHRFFGERERTTDHDDAAHYLDALVGDDAPRELRSTYLDRGPEALEFYESIGIPFRHSRTVVDYHPEIPGAGVGRALEPEPFDGRRLGRAEFARVRGPIREFALFGGTLMIRRVEVDELLRIYAGSPRAAARALSLGVRWASDRLHYPRGTRLTMGNALVARLFSTLRRLGGGVEFASTAKELLVVEGRVVGAVVQAGGYERRVHARHGIVLAGGGFAASARWRAAQLPQPTPQFSPAAEGATGDTIELGLAAGGALSASVGDNAFWFPSSVQRRRDGSLAVYPHIWDRAKPGIIAVGRNGRRFVDESVSYHRFTRAMFAANADRTAIPTWLVIDAASLRRYGLGLVRPHASALTIRRLVRSGYLHRGTTLAALASDIRVDPTGLIESVEEANASAESGVDARFAKGTSTFGHQYGDATHTPNQNLGPIARAPFYAIAVFPTPLGTARGLRIDERARVLDASDAPIGGLYACGNDAQSVMGSEYPGAGCQVGSGLIFGYLAALNLTAPSAERATAARKG